MPTATVNPTDTGLRSGAADLNNSTSASHIVGTIAGQGMFRMALRFDLNSQPPMIASAATLTLKNFTTGGVESVVDGLYYARRINQPSWAPTTATWNRYDGATLWTLAGGDYTTTNQGTCTILVGTSDLVFTGLATLVQDAFTNRSGLLDLVVMGSELSNENVIVYSVDDLTSSNRPVLSITYTLDAGTLYQSKTSPPLYRSEVFPLLYQSKTSAPLYQSNIT